jgi:hypothetical protein
MTTWLVDRDWGAELTDGYRRHGTALRIICPFIKVRPVVELLTTSQPPRFEVVTRFNLADFGSGISDLAALRVILEAGGRVRCRTGSATDARSHGGTVDPATISASIPDRPPAPRSFVRPSLQRERDPEEWPKNKPALDAVPLEDLS